jgi:hypothetical protein
MVVMVIVTVIIQGLRMGTVCIKDLKYVFMWLRQEDILTTIKLIVTVIMVIKIVGIVKAIAVAEAMFVDKTKNAFSFREGIFLFKNKVLEYQFLLTNNHLPFTANQTDIWYFYNFLIPL